MNDLWPNDLQVTNATIRTPASILKEQATYLGQKTNNLVLGLVTRFEAVQDFIDPRLVRADNTKIADTLSVVQPSKESPRLIRYAFTLQAPAIRYSLRLFTIAHPLDCYPTEINAHPNISLSAEGSQVLAANEQELVTVLAAIFSAEFTRRVISSLYVQSISDAAIAS